MWKKEMPKELLFIRTSTCMRRKIRILLDLFAKDMKMGLLLDESAKDTTLELTYTI